MVRVIARNWHWVVILLLLILSVIFYEVAAYKDKSLKEQLEYQNVKASTDSLRMRQLIRMKEEEAFKYRDSLRQANINYILLKNEKSRKQTSATIQRIKSNPSTEFRDSLWAEEWSRKDSLPY
jgi:hypothetical protein